MTIFSRIKKFCSSHFSKNRFLSIGIAAGDFSNLDNYLIPVFNARLSGDPVIRLTDYARQCVLINDIRALLCSKPVEITLLNGETLPVWWVEGFWSTLYFDFIPDLLDDPILGSGANAVVALAARLWPSVVDAAYGPDKNDNDAISILFRSPHNSLLCLEIAKTLYYRRYFREALEILRIVLSLDPTHLNARALRMVLLRNLAIEAPSYRVAQGLFEQSHQEARYIQQRCDYHSEDFYCEYAVVFLAQAMLALRHMRSETGLMGSTQDVPELSRQVLDRLDQAESLLGMGIMVSSTGIRAMYLLNSVKVLKTLLSNNRDLFLDGRKPIDGPMDLIKETCLDFQRQMGLLRDDLPQDQPFDVIENIILFTTASHDDSIALQAYRPTTYFCSAVSWWDLFPIRTVGLAKRALSLLRDSADIAKEMGKKNVCIYSFTRTYGEMMPVDEFVSHIENAIRMIRTQAGPNLSGRPDKEIIESVDGSRKGLVMTLNF
ncbi:MAG: hypothetical protein KKD44_15550 [Proteobacteria bacterium]|nr:hypothetical protein [Pseudomonadota bacterium]